MAAYPKHQEINSYSQTMKAYLCTHTRTHTQTHTTRKLAFKDWPNWTVTNLDKTASSAMACEKNKKQEALDYTCNTEKKQEMGLHATKSRPHLHRQIP